MGRKSGRALSFSTYCMVVLITGLTLFLTGTVAIAGGGEDAFEKYMSAGKNCFDRGDLSGALNRVKAAEAEARTLADAGKGDGPLLESLTVLVMLCKTGSRFEDAEKYAREVVLLTCRGSGDNEVKAFAVNDLATVLKRAGKYSESAAAYRQALLVLGPQGKESIAAATLHDNLGIVLQIQKLWQEAFAEHEIAYKIYSRLAGPGAPDTYLCQGNMGQALFGLGEFAQAEVLMKEALAGVEQHEGKDSIGAATFCDNLAVLYCRQGEPAKAESMQVRALGIYTRKVGRENPDALICMGNLALTYERQGKLKEARKTAGEAFEIAVKVLGEAHPVTERLRNILSGLAIPAP